MKVSVIIPAYNSSKTIKASLESAINQSYLPHEIIVVNDGSVDDTEGAVKAIVSANKDANIAYVYKKNEGPSIARNLGIEMATGDLIAFLDSDDKWLKDKLKHQVNLFKEKTDLYLLGGLYKENTRSKNRFVDITFKELLLSNQFFTSATVVRRSVFKTVKPFRTDKKHSEDYNLWLRILAEYKGGILNEKVFTYATESGINDDGLSGDLWMMEKGELDNYKEMYTLNYISFTKLMALRIFSILKYIRRVLKKQLR